LGEQPGLFGHDSAALSYALSEAKKRLPHPPKKKFAAAFKNLMLRTRDMAEAQVAILKKLGLKVTDPAFKAYSPYSGAYGPLVRKHIQQGWMTVPRYLNRGIIQEIADHLKEKGWSDTAPMDQDTEISPWDYIKSLRTGESTEEVGESLTKINAVIEMLFDQRAIDSFVDPYMRMDRTIFTKLGDEPINGLMVQSIWEDSGGNMMQFLMSLSDAVYPPGSVTDAERIAFLSKSLFRFKQYYDVYDDIVQGMRSNPDPLSVNSETPRRMQDARTMSMFPPEHFDHDVYDTQSTSIHLAQIAFSKAFGQESLIIGSKGVHKGAVKLISALTNLSLELDKKESSLAQLNKEFDQGSKKRTRRAIVKAGRGRELKTLERQTAARSDVKHWKNQLLDIFASDQGPMKDVKALYDFVGFMAIMTLNNPKTGLWNLLSTMDFPLTMRQLNRTSVGASVTALSTSAKGAAASFLQIFGLHIFKQTEHGKGWGQYWFKTAEQQLPLREFMSNTGYQNAFLEDNRMPENIKKKVVQRSSRWAKRLMTKGMGTGDWASFNALWGPFDWVIKVAMHGVAMGYISGAESTVGKVAKWLVESGNVNNPAAEATAEDVGMGGRGIFGSAETFEYYKGKFFDNDLGTIEDMARQFIAQGSEKGNSFDLPQVIALGNTAMAEVAGEGGMNTNSPGFYKDAILKFGSILLRWPIFVMNRAHKLITSEEGELTLAATSKGLAIMGMWSAPIGLAATLLMDEYDFWFLRKKSNLREVGTDQSLMGNTLAVVERLARSGNVYGLGMDSINQLINVVDPQAGQRAGVFELDSRVLVLSQIKNVQMALLSMMRQSSGWSPEEIGLSYDTVMRPLLMSLGFNGPVQYAQIFNNAMGATNAEAKVTYKINISNWVSATARELGLELRSGGGFSSATPMSRWVRQMLLAAYSNDREKFMHAHRRAVTEARKAFPGNPEEAEKRVLASWRSRGPFERLRYKPSDIQLSQIYSAMPNRGADSLREASHRYDMYNDLFTPSGSGPKIPSAEDIRKKLMRSVTGSSTNAEDYTRELFRSVTSSRY